jgi:hypothetical protein
MVLTVKVGFIISSAMYKIFKEGMAIKINIPTGRDVQNNSISWFSLSIRLKDILCIEEISK